jgi:alkylated DNA nucleotide flippase Atl1
MMQQRRILQIDNTGAFCVATEARFDSEERLHEAIARHPEVLPTEDLGMGALVTLANELDLGHGPIDTLAADGAGRLVIIEFKRGSENPDVRKVVAQVLDYGTSLWKLAYDELEERARACHPGLHVSLVDHVAERLGSLGIETFDRDAFRRGVETCLDTGDFVFLYVARDLDDRTRRVMTYLGEGARMTFFGVEVDYFQAQGHASVLVPRVAFVPSWVAEQSRPGRSGVTTPALTLEEAPEEVRLLVERLDDVARELGLVTSYGRASRIYRPARNASGVAVYLNGKRVEFNLESFRRRDEDKFAEDFLARLDRVADRPVHRGNWPGVPADALLTAWDTARAEVIEHYFKARLAHIEDEAEPRPLDVDRLHQLLRWLPAGKWTTYGDVASAVGSHARAVGGHIGNCPDCTNAWRVLQTDGRVSPGFRWNDAADRRDPRQVLVEEGVRFSGERAHQDERLSSADLSVLLPLE